MKKLFALLLALIIVFGAMSVTAFAEEHVLFDNADGDSLGIVDPWDGFGIGKFAAVNDKSIGELTIGDVRDIAAAGGAKLVFEFGCSSIATWQTTSPEVQFNCWQDEEALQVNTELTDLGNGRYLAVAELDTLVANLEATGKTTADIENLGVQVWVNDFVLYNAKLLTGDEAAAFAPPAVEAPAEDTPVEDTPVEAPADDTPAEDAPAETGLTLAVLPAVIALAVVAFKKR